VGRKILVVDDDPDIVKIVELWLAANNYEVHTAHSGEEGLIKCKLIRPDAVILDIMMPDLDGSIVADEIKNDPNTSNIPVIFLTGAVKASEVPKSHKIGGQYFLAKPFKGEEMIQMLEIVFSA
jgi:two-component system, OmpR family, alkaline phosphatase synthesis response regulator PhoP